MKIEKVSPVKNGGCSFTSHRMGRMGNVSVFLGPVREFTACLNIDITTLNNKSQKDAEISEMVYLLSPCLISKAWMSL
jgi:ABC-type sulfate transport system permease subunit